MNMYRNITYFFDICVAALPALVIPLGLAALIALGVVLGGCARHQEPVGETVIQGVVTYRERMALPANAEYTVLLYEVTPGIGRTLLSEVTIPTEGASVPLPFQIAPQNKPLSATGSYELEARIRVGTEILFMTPAAVPVVEGSEATLLLYRDMEMSTAPVLPGSAALSGRKWLLREIGGQKAEVWPDQEAPHLLFTPDSSASGPSATITGRLSGSDGCNRLIGSYTQTGSNLHFQNLGSTMMLCPQGAEQAAAFSRALADISGWRLAKNGQSLELLQHNRRLLLFVPAPTEKKSQ